MNKENKKIANEKEQKAAKRTAILCLLLFLLTICTTIILVDKLNDYVEGVVQAIAEYTNTPYTPPEIEVIFPSFAIGFQRRSIFAFRRLPAFSHPL